VIIGIVARPGVEHVAPQSSRKPVSSTSRRHVAQTGVEHVA
jgi:hypothetical protein